MQAPSRVLPFGKRRPLKAALPPTLIATLEAQQLDAQECFELFEEFVLTRPHKIAQLKAYMRAAVTTEPPQPILSAAYCHVDDKFDVRLVSVGLQNLLGIRAFHFMGQRWRGYLENPHDVARLRRQFKLAVRVHQGFEFPLVRWCTAGEEIVDGRFKVTPRDQAEFHGWTVEIIPHAAEVANDASAQN